jgi:hypothetical protein
VLSADPKTWASGLAESHGATPPRVDVDAAQLMEEPIPFLRKGSRDKVRDATGTTKLPTPSCPTGRSSPTPAQSSLGSTGRRELAAQVADAGQV